MSLCSYCLKYGRSFLSKVLLTNKGFIIFLLTSVAIPAFQELPSFSRTRQWDFEIRGIPEEAAALQGYKWCHFTCAWVWGPSQRADLQLLESVGGMGHGWSRQSVRLFTEGQSYFLFPIAVLGPRAERSQSLWNLIPMSLSGTGWKCVAGSE